MRILHNDALALERIVRRVYSCDYGGVFGMALADWLESDPFDAAILSLSPFWSTPGGSEYKEEISEFLCEWRFNLRSEQNESVSVREYIDTLSNFVDKLMNY